jgi:hypothetical protein
MEQEGEADQRDDDEFLDQLGPEIIDRIQDQPGAVLGDFRSTPSLARPSERPLTVGARLGRAQPSSIQSTHVGALLRRRQSAGKPRAHARQGD